MAGFVDIQMEINVIGGSDINSVSYVYYVHYYYNNNQFSNVCVDTIWRFELLFKTR